MSNNRMKFTMEFDKGDAPMIAQAFSIARNTAMMCGHPEARDKFDRFREFVRQFAPAVSRYFDEEDWALMVAELQKVETFSVAFVPKYSWLSRKRFEDEGEVVITIGARTFKASPYKMPGITVITRAVAFSIREELVSCAPMDCICEATEIDADEEIRDDNP